MIKINELLTYLDRYAIIEAVRIDECCLFRSAFSSTNKRRKRGEDGDVLTVPVVLGDGEHLKKGENAMFQTYHGQTAKFIATVAQNMPPLTADVMQEWIENPRLLAKALAEALMPPVEHTPTPSQQRAREIMGRNMFGVEEAIKLFNVRPTAKQLAVLAEVPFSEEVLQEYRDTHILVADFGLSIMDVKALHPELFYDKDDACWYNTEPFAEKRGKVCWRLVRKTVVPDSYSKTYLDQMALLDKNEENPEVRVMVYTIIGHFLATEERLFGRVYTRCQDLSSGGRRVVVGGFGSGGLDVSRCWDGRRVVSVGLASARKVRSS